MLSRSVLFVVASLSLAGCATSSIQGERKIWPYDQPPVVGSEVPSQPEPNAAQSVARADAPDATGQKAFPRSAEEISGPAVRALVKQARSAVAGGQSEQASAALERALRIEPRNYFVWSMLAQTYLAQGKYQQADSIARKSNALAQGNLYAELDNWRTIAAACNGRGDSACEATARQRTADLEQSLRPDTSFW